jgi:MFS family permease
MLLPARALQGIFAALIAPATLALLNTTFTEPGTRAKAFSFYTAAAMSGGAIGLVVGGVLTDFLNWRWCLYVNIPIALAVLVGGVLTVPSPPRQLARLDVPGVLLSAGGMVALIYGLGEAGAVGWGSPVIIGAFVAAVLLFTAFVVVQSRSRSPLLPLQVLTNRNSGASFLAMAISAFTTYGMLLGMTYQLQAVMGYSPLRTGLAFLAYVLTAVVFSTQVATRLVRRLRPGLMVASGLGIFAVALLTLLRLRPDSSYLTGLLPALLLFGIGVGMLTVPAITTAMSVTDPRYSGAVSAVVNTAQQTGGSIGAALLNTISVSAALTYLAAHPGGQEATLAASTHGFVTASMWSAGLAVLVALGVVLAINFDVRQREPELK